jgi:hypothetical protein
MKEKLISIKELRVGQVFIPETWTKERAAEWKCIAIQIAHDGVVKAMCYLHDSMDYVLDSHVAEFFDMNVYVTNLGLRFVDGQYAENSGLYDVQN